MRLAEGQVRPVVAGRPDACCRRCCRTRMPRKADRAMKAMLQMRKIDIAALQQAAA